VRILYRVSQPLLDSLNDIFSNQMFDLLGIVMHVIALVLSCVGQVELPKAVVANDLAGAMPTGLLKLKSRFAAPFSIAFRVDVTG